MVINLEFSTFSCGGYDMNIEGLHVQVLHRNVLCDLWMKERREKKQLVLLLTKRTIIFFLICFIQTFLLASQQWDWNRNCSAQNSLPLKPRARKEESPHVRSVPARVGEPVLCSKVELFESLHQPTALTSWQCSKLVQKTLNTVIWSQYEQYNTTYCVIKRRYSTGSQSPS